MLSASSSSLCPVRALVSWILVGLWSTLSRLHRSSTSTRDFPSESFRKGFGRNRKERPTFLANSCSTVKRGSQEHQQSRVLAHPMLVERLHSHTGAVTQTALEITLQPCAIASILHSSLELEPSGAPSSQ